MYHVNGPVNGPNDIENPENIVKAHSAWKGVEYTCLIGVGFGRHVLGISRDAPLRAAQLSPLAGLIGSYQFPIEYATAKDYSHSQKAFEILTNEDTNRHDAFTAAGAIVGLIIRRSPVGMAYGITMGALFDWPLQGTGYLNVIPAPGKSFYEHWPNECYRFTKECMPTFIRYMERQRDEMEKTMPDLNLRVGFGPVEAQPHKEPEAYKPELEVKNLSSVVQPTDKAETRFSSVKNYWTLFSGNAKAVELPASEGFVSTDKTVETPERPGKPLTWGEWLFGKHKQVENTNLPVDSLGREVKFNKVPRTVRTEDESMRLVFRSKSVAAQQHLETYRQMERTRSQGKGGIGKWNKPAPQFSIRQPENSAGVANQFGPDANEQMRTLYAVMDKLFRENQHPLFRDENKQ